MANKAYSVPIEIVPGGGGGGTVTSVTFTGDGAILSSTPSAPVTTSGTLNATAATQSGNKFIASPANGSSGPLTARTIVAADIPSGTVAWNNIGNATGNLTLANGTNTTEFDQTSAATWKWYNTTAATISTTNASPVLELSATYWNATSAADVWSIGSALAVGFNGASTLSFTHSGSPGRATVAIPQTATFNLGSGVSLSYVANGVLGVGDTAPADFSSSLACGQLQIGQSNLNAAFQIGVLSSTTSIASQFKTTLSTGYCLFEYIGPNNQLFMGVERNSGGGIMTNDAGNAAVLCSEGAYPLQFGTNGVATMSISSTGLVGILSGSVYGWAGSATIPSTALDTGISRVSAGIIGVGTGAAGSIAGSIQCSSIALNGAVASPTAGVYYSGTTAGVTQTAQAVGTLATIGGIVTTFTAVSDERLKDFVVYKGGLDEILSINPIKYRWNQTGKDFIHLNDDTYHVGFSAQNVQKAIPEAIQGTEGEEKYLSFDDRPVICALVNAVKTLSERLALLEKK